MAHNTQDTDGDVATDGGGDGADEAPAWKQKDVLEEHVERGDTYEEIADEYEDATEAAVGRAVRDHGLTPLHHRPKFEGPDVPVRLIDDVDVEHPVPHNVTEVLPIEGGDPLRYHVELDGMDLAVHVEAGDHVTGEWSNERRATQRDTIHPTARYVRRLAHAIGLPDLLGGMDTEAATAADDAGDADAAVEFTGGILGGDGDGDDEPATGNGDDVEDEPAVTATCDVVDDTRFRVDFSPAPSPWSPSTTAGPPGELESIERKLTPIWPSNMDLDTRSAANPGVYQLAFPLEWAKVYELGAVDEVGQYLGVFQDDGETRLGVGISFAPDQEDHPGLQTGLHTSRKGVTDVAEREVQVVYPVKALLHTLGIGVQDRIQDVDVKLIPGENWVGIVPA